MFAIIRLAHVEVRHSITHVNLSSLNASFMAQFFSSLPAGPV